MRSTMAIRSKAGATLAATALAAAVLLSGCSGRDTLLAEQTAAAEQQAIRAEKAADRAETAANQAERSAAPAPAAEAEADPAEDAANPASDGPIDPTPTDQAKAAT